MGHDSWKDMLLLSSSNVFFQHFDTLNVLMNIVFNVVSPHFKTPLMVWFGSVWSLDLLVKKMKCHSSIISEREQTTAF